MLGRLKLILLQNFCLQESFKVPLALYLILFCNRYKVKLSLSQAALKFYCPHWLATGALFEKIKEKFIKNHVHHCRILN